MSKSKHERDDSQPKRTKEETHKLRREIKRQLHDLEGHEEDWYEEEIPTFEPIKKRKGK